MCRLFLATGKLKATTQRQLLFAVNEAFRFNQRDGFGFVSIGAADQIAHGRYLSPNHFPGYGIAPKLPAFLTCPAIEVGPLPPIAHTLLIHGRTSTNNVCVQNCHPFRQADCFLAHNGILSWKGEWINKPKAPNNCDSEEFFLWAMDYWAQGKDVWADTFSHWGGFGAVILTEASSGLTVVAQDDAKLWCAKRAKGEGWVFTTDKEDLKTICLKAGIYLSTPPLECPRQLMFFDRSGKMASNREWAGFGPGNGHYSAQQFHRAYGDKDDNDQLGFFSNGHDARAGKRQKYKHTGKANTITVLGEGSEVGKVAEARMISEQSGQLPPPLPAPEGIVPDMGKGSGGNGYGAAMPLTKAEADALREVPNLTPEDRVAIESWTEGMGAMD